MPTCKPCAGTGKRYPGFADAPHGTCLVCGGYGSTPEPPAPATASPSPSYGPFKFTDDESVKVALALRQLRFGEGGIDDTLRKIEAIINEGTEQES